MSDDRGHEPYLRLFDEIERELPGAELPWLAALRREAAAQLRERGFPTRRDEDWRYTDLSPLVRTGFQAAPPNLWHSSATPGLRISRLRDALEQRPERLEPHLGQLADFKAQPFVALNTALFEDGVLVEIEPGARLEEPIRIELTGCPDGASHARILILAGAGSQAQVLERYAGEGSYFNDVVTELILDRDARLDHLRIQRESEQAYHVASLVAHQEAASRLTSHSIALGGRIARVDLQTTLAAPGAECHLTGLYLGRGAQLVDHCTLIDHAMPHTTSRELYKGILTGRARGVFRGRVHVRPDAQKTDASQTNRNLLLSDDAIANTKPQLEIYADDVKCSHGATVGRLAEEAIFYLRSRGIPLAEARSILTYGFASEITSKLPSAALRREIEQFVLDWLPRFDSGGEDA